MNLDELKTDDLADELKKRGYIVWPDFDIEAAITGLEQHGFHVHNENNFDEFLKDLYYEVCVLTPEQTVKALNQMFIRHIEKWM